MTQPAEQWTHEQKLAIGVSRLGGHMLNLAELIFLEVLQAAPGDPTALRLLGVTRAKLGRGEIAIADLRAATAAAPRDELAWRDLAVALRDAGQAADAAAAHARAAGLRAQGAAARALAPLEALTFEVERVEHQFKVIDYPYKAEIRYGAGRPAHPELSAIIGAGRERYSAFIAELGEIQGDLAKIPLGGDYEASKPFWLNSWFPGLDGMALIQMLRRYNPRGFVEIGSGISTKFARQAVETYGLRTKLVSIDPQPRSEVDRLCDQVIRKPLEACDMRMFEAMEPGDMLFLDSSHRAFQGSDVTVFFLEILPRVKPGVILHIHDIYLPDDYIGGHVRRLWNEQYLLATALLFGGSAFEILFPCWFVGQDPALRAQAMATLCQGPLRELDPYGASFWMRKT
jgi:tetratricopeptide (TPR) repeat protein